MLNPYRDQIQPNPGKDRRTMLVLLISTVFIGGFMLYTISLTFNQTTEDDSPFTEENDWGGGDFRDRLGYTDIELPDDLAAEIREDTEALRVLKESRPFNFLLREVIDRPFRFFNDIGYTSIPGDTTPAAVVADPDANRAKHFSAKGTLLSLERKDIELPAPTAEVWEGVVRIDETTDGQPSYVYFESVEEPIRARVGDVVNVYGIFYKSFNFTVQDGDTSSFATGPYMIARRVKRTFYYEEVTELDRNIIARARDHDEMARMIVEDEPWYHIASYVKNADIEQIKTEYTEDDELMPLFQFPGAHRGRIVKFRGKLIQLEKVRIEDNPAGIESYYDGILHSLDSVTVRMRFIHKPTGVKRGDLVSVRGVFMKKHKYDSQAETAPEVPLIIGLSIDHVEFVDKTLNHISVALTVIAATLVLVFGVSLALNRKSARAFETAYWERRRSRMQKRGQLDGQSAAPTQPANHESDA